MYAGGGATANEYGPTSASIIADGTWQRIAADPIVIQQNDRTILGVVLYVNPGLSSGQFFNIDGVQIELNSKATPYTDTSRPTGQGDVGKAILAQKPAGLQFTYTVSPGDDYAFVTATYATYAVLLTKYQTYGGLAILKEGT